MIINSGILPTIIHLMKQKDYSQLQREAAWILTNVASGTTPQCKAIVNLGAIPLFIDLLTNPDSDIVEQAIWGIGNIASDCIEYRNTIIKAGGIQIWWESPIIRRAQI
jgi:importin subunit alpha-6/7